MSDFVHTLKDARKLRGATQSLSTKELEQVLVKIKNILVEKQLVAEAATRENQQKQQALEDIKAKLAQYNISTEDLLNSDRAAAKLKKQKRPYKYQYTDEDGETHRWGGAGKMPLVFRKALASGKTLEDLAIHKKLSIHKKSCVSKKSVE